jgi:hypothetical protein
VLTGPTHLPGEAGIQAEVRQEDHDSLLASRNQRMALWKLAGAQTTRL